MTIINSHSDPPQPVTIFMTICQSPVLKCPEAAMPQSQSVFYLIYIAAAHFPAVNLTFTKDIAILFLFNLFWKGAD